MILAEREIQYSYEFVYLFVYSSFLWVTFSKKMGEKASTQNGGASTQQFSKTRNKA